MNKDVYDRKLYSTGDIFSSNCLKCDVPNNNGIMYPKDIVKTAIKEITLPLLGCIDSDNRDVNIDLSKVSHKVTSFEFEGDILKCDIELLDTPQGKIIKQLFDDGRNLVTNTMTISKLDTNRVVTECKLAQIYIGVDDE